TSEDRSASTSTAAPARSGSVASSTSTPSIRRPRTSGSRSRRIVSTSGNSGTGQAYRQPPPRGTGSLLHEHPVRVALLDPGERVHVIRQPRPIAQPPACVRVVPVDNVD